MHGTTMMFLFAVPAMEALGVMLLPQMLAARDLPFPRLSAFAIWAYVIGGLVFFSTILYDLAPDGGWFMYPPLTLTEYQPGDNADFWLLGIGFIEISAIAGAIEIVVGVLRTRPPGMSLVEMPIFAWSMLIFAGMIIFAFPAVILATMLLELERAFGWPFFSAELGGDALLWQHLFWFFGHPEVYIIFLPAAGLVSMMVPTIARTPLVGYRLIVVALIATGFFSFGLWVHHMFTTGIPGLSLALLLRRQHGGRDPVGHPGLLVDRHHGRRTHAWRMTTPALFILGFLFIFVLGGLTGVMVAIVPFDFQVHDTYFVVAHLHYVLVGGMVFPLFATFYYWAPVFSRRPLSRTARQMGVLADVHRLQRRVLSHAHHRARGHAAAGLDLSVQSRLGHAEPHLDRRRLRSRRRCAGLPHRSRPQLPPRKKGAATSGMPARSNGCPTTSTRPAASRTSPAATAVGPAQSRRGGRGGRALPARCTDRRPRDDRHLADRREAGIHHPDAGPRMEAGRCGRVHGRVLPAADDQGGQLAVVCGVIALASSWSGCGSSIPARKRARSTSAGASRCRPT